MTGSMAGRQPIFRFAPSPNGRLHLGHAYSALLNLRMARATGGRMLLRIEDTDTVRCTPAHERAMLEDLEWIGFEWDEPPLRQSEHFDRYRDFAETLQIENLAYPAFMSRSEIRERVALEESGGVEWPRDPDGAPVYPGDERDWSEAHRESMIMSGAPYALRLDSRRAIARVASRLTWEEAGAGPNGETGEVEAKPEIWGDIVLARKDTPASYHLACVLDDAYQEVTHVVRGRDLFPATAVHRLLQELAGLDAPEYFHHDLIEDADGTKLSKSRGDTSLTELRQAGFQPSDIRRKIGLA